MNTNNRGDHRVVSEGDSMMSDGIAVVLVNFNGTSDTLKCLESLRDQAVGRALIVVVDNGSASDDSASIALAHPWTSVIRREVNGGWAGGNNEGINFALARGASRVVLLNNDTIVAANFLDRMFTAAEARPDYGIIGPIICFMEEPLQVMTDGCDFKLPGDPGFFHRHPVAISPGEMTEVDIVNGCCMMIEAEVFRQIGLIDERFFLIHEESDFCLRAKLAGFRAGVLGESLVWHKGSSSFKRSGKGTQRYYDARNLFLLLNKHRGTCRGSRGRLRSWAEYGKYVYYRYSLEREQGETEAAEAVIRGLLDAIGGRYGAAEPGPRKMLPIVRGLFEFGRSTRTRFRTVRV